MNRTLLKTQLVRHEADKRFPYKDTEGHLTIGVGRNLEAKPLSDAIVRLMLEEDIDEAEIYLRRLVPFYTSLEPLRQQVFANMMFNLGPKRLLEFKKFLAAVEARDFDKAAAEMLDSRWARQVGDRAIELATMMKDGV